MADTKDIVPELYEQITKAYKSNLKKESDSEGMREKARKRQDGIFRADTICRSCQRLRRKSTYLGFHTGLPGKKNKRFTRCVDSGTGRGRR